MRIAVIAILAIPLGGCAFLGKVSEGIQCNEPATAFMNNSGATVALTRPPAKDCAYWLKRGS